MTRACIVAAILLGPCLCGCKHWGRDGEVLLEPESAVKGSTECGPGLSREEVVAVARQAMEILWADSSLEGFDVRIEPARCDYHFFAIRKGTEAAEDIYFSIDRSSRVNSAPECWWLGDLGNCPAEEGRTDVPQGVKTWPQYRTTPHSAGSEISRRYLYDSADAPTTTPATS